MNPFKRNLTFTETLLGIFGGFLSYVLIAVFNLSNEDVYNWDIALIFSQGGALNSISLIAFWLWLLVMIVWMSGVIFRLIKLLTK